MVLRPKYRIGNPYREGTVEAEEEEIGGWVASIFAFLHSIQMENYI